jgi:hypothetical protein
MINKLTPWSRVFLDKLIVTQLIKKLSAFYGSRRFITVFTRVIPNELEREKMLSNEQKLNPLRVIIFKDRNVKTMSPVRKIIDYYRQFYIIDHRVT